METKNISRITKLGIVLLALSSCVNLRTLNRYSENSIEAVKKYEAINFTFKQSCKTNCHLRETAIGDYLDNIYPRIKRKSDCNCDVYLQADSSFNKIYFSINQYLTGLQKLSSNSILEFKYDSLSNSLKESSLINISDQEIDAYSRLGELTTRCITDIKRRKNLQLIIKDGNEPFGILIEELKYATSEILVESLDTELELHYNYYQDALVNQDKFSGKELLDFEQAFIKQRVDIEQKVDLLNQYAVILNEVKIGHQQLYENADKIHKKEIATLLSAYLTEINQLKSDFNNLNAQ